LARGALLDAAIEVLGEVGYASFTTRQVSARAGVSRGAQTHHFGSKRDLVEATVERLYEQQAASIRRETGSSAGSGCGLGSALHLLWGVAQGPAFAALLEVAVAARTDGQLQAELRVKSLPLRSAIAALITDRDPELDSAAAEALGDQALAIVQGAALRSHNAANDADRIVRVASHVANLFRPETLNRLGRATSRADAPEAR
jgi:AcrR family transcriptional regulator